ILYLLLFFAFTVKAQVPNNPKNDDADNQQNQNIEILSEQNQQEDADYTNLVETLNNFRANPINLNNTSKDELEDLQLLTEIQINNLLNHIEKNGRLITIYELQGVRGFDLGTIRKILPYVKVSDNFSSSHFTIGTMFRNGSHEVITRYQRILEHQKGFDKYNDSLLGAKPSAYYLGSPERVFMRYRFKYSNNVSWGLIAEKDAGERFQAIDSLHKKAGFDFYTAHLFIRNIGIIKSLAIGDYQASFGQGLVMWRGFAFGKSSAILNVKRNAMGLRAYNSVDENRYLRGAATTLKFNKIETTVFYSRKKIDANVTAYDTINGTLSDPEEISSLIQTGTHATISELKDKDVITETIMGANVSYRGKRLSIGTTAQAFQLSAGLNKTPNDYNRYDFTGKKNANAGIDFSYVFRNVNLFGEGAIAQNGGKAFTGGAVVALDPKLTFVAMYRKFDRNYQNLLALAVSENTLPQNEQGLYLGVEARISRNLTFTSYFDQFRFPWLKSSVSAPSNGSDFFSQLNWTPNKKTSMYFRYRNRTRQEDTSIPDMFNYPVPVQQENFRYNVSFQLLPSIKLRSRIEYITYRKQDSKPETGMLIFQDVVYKQLGKPLEVTFRYGLFETDGYNSRVYSYENDVLYSFSIPALYNKGSRVYLMFDYTVTRRIEVWARIAQTFYTNQTIQNAGSTTEIKGPAKTEIKLQLRYKI
ncbi:MAG: ComEA family DNA-binding protein, partial [Bacteroidia bacterium]